ncbi:MAG: diacylglycerol kinase family protein [Verrucomicrobiota bacterium]
MNFLKCFKYAGRGVLTLLQTQRNARMHACFMAGVIAAGFYFKINGVEWCLIILAAMCVWIAEAVNTALEFLADCITEEYHPLIKQAKDTAAAAVLIAAMGSLVIGAFVFSPYLLNLMNKD